MAPVLFAVPDLLPVQAVVGSSPELFAGSIRGETIILKSEKGAECVGRVRVGDMGYGWGNLRCSDGRFGTFDVDIKGRFGSGWGRLGQDHLKLIIG